MKKKPTCGRAAEREQQEQLGPGFGLGNSRRQLLDTVRRSKPPITASLHLRTVADAQRRAGKLQASSRNKRNRSATNKRSKKITTPERFELSRGNPMYLAGTRLNHSAKASLLAEQRISEYFTTIFMAIYSPNEEDIPL